MMHVTFDSEKIMAKVEKLVDNLSSIDVDAAVISALDEVADALLALMQESVRRHYKKGRAYKAIRRTEVQQAGNRFFVEVGAFRIRHEDKDGFHVIYQEYGSPGKFAADPWLRPALEQKAMINSIIMNTFKKWGLPNVKAA